MARIAISTFGSLGGLNPFMSLGITLRTRDHQVLFVVEKNSADSFKDAGFAISYMTGDGFTALTPYIKQMFSSSNPVSSFKVIINHWIIPNLRSNIEEMRRVCREADLLIARAGSLAAPIVSELTGVPWVQVTMTPLTIPSSYIAPHPLPLYLPEFLQRPANRLAWSMIVAVLRILVDNSANKIRAEYGLPHQQNMMVRNNQSRTLTAVAVSPSFFSRPYDWPSYVRVTGFCFWDTPARWIEPTNLTTFLNQVEPVIAVSSGSMAIQSNEAFVQFFRTSVAAIRRVGARALVIGAPPSTFSEQLPDDVLTIPFAPFSQVYPRCVAVIHHGGPGTTAQALRAGIPELVLPWGLEQFFTAAQVERIGAGRWLYRSFYTTNRAVQALRVLLDEASYKQNSRSMASQIAQENGSATLCDAIEEVLQY